MKSCFRCILQFCDIYCVAMNSARVWGQATYDMGDPTKELTKHCMQHPIQPHNPAPIGSLTL